MTRQRQPNSNDCFVCGLQNPLGLKMVFYDNGADEVYCEYTVGDNYQGYPGIAHGGIVAAMMDEVLGRTVVIDDHFMMTARFELKYRQPVPLNTPLKLIGRRIKQRGRLAQARGELRLPDDTLAVEAMVTLVGLPDDLAVDTAGLEQLGWRVYDD